MQLFTYERIYDYLDLDKYFWSSLILHPIFMTI